MKKAKLVKQEQAETHKNTVGQCVKIKDFFKGQNPFSRCIVFTPKNIMDTYDRISGKVFIPCGLTTTIQGYIERAV